MSPYGRRACAWSFAGAFLLVQALASVHAVAHAMQHAQHDARPHAPAGCAWLHVADESLEVDDDKGLSGFVLVAAAEVPVSRPIGILLPLQSCSRAPPRFSA